MKNADFKDIKLIITDFDGTLLRDDKSVSDYTKNVLYKCRGKGILAAVATGRPERAVKYAGLDGLWPYVIANNGARITFEGETIYNDPLPEKTKLKLIGRFINDKKVKSIAAETGDLLYTNDKNHLSWSANADWKPVYTEFDGPLTDEILKIAAECGDVSLMKNIARENPEVMLLYSDKEDWHHFTHVTATKFNAAVWLCNALAIDIKDVIAFGDDYNDADMLRGCGCGVAVGNAADEAKEAADFVCDTNENDGLAKFLERNIL